MSIEDTNTPQSLEAAFHCAIKNLVSKPMQARIMGAFRQVWQDRDLRLADIEIQITNPWKNAIVNAWCAKGVRAMYDDPQKAVAELLDEARVSYATDRIEIGALLKPMRAMKGVLKISAHPQRAEWIAVKGHDTYSCDDLKHLIYSVLRGDGVIPGPVGRITARTKPRLDLEGNPFGTGGGPITMPDETCPFCGIKTDTPCDVAPAGPCEQAISSTAQGHVLYTDKDTDRPDVICDRNGQVVLGLCKVCGKAEVDLAEPCK